MNVFAVIVIIVILTLFGYGTASVGYADERRKAQREYENMNASHKEHYAQLLSAYEAIKKLYDDMQNISNKSFFSLTSAYIDIKLVADYNSAKYLERKKRPAYAEAWRIKEVVQEKRELILEFKEMQYKYDFLINTFPELKTYISDFDSMGSLMNIKNIQELKNDYDMTAQYLSKDEYMSLGINERNQLALDKYINGRKSNWQIGRDYELYCGYVLRKEGMIVEQHGIEKKLNDMGRDIIAHHNHNIYVVQCKLWSQMKMIHENQIAQLFGTTIMYELETNAMIRAMYKVKPMFITNIKLSETAERFAKRLGVEIRTLNMGKYPRIKCNINNGNKIYHLPFDQQYDSAKIEKEGEFYAMTVDEAVKKGFRRAYRHAYNAG